MQSQASASPTGPGSSTIRAKGATMQTITDGNHTTSKTITFPLNHHAGLLAGYNWPSEVSIEVDLATFTQAERDYLVAHLDVTNNHYRCELDCVSTEEIVAAIKAAAAADAADDVAKRQAGEQAARTALGTPLGEWVTVRSDGWSLVHRPDYPLYDAAADAYTLYPGIAERLREAEAEVARLNEKQAQAKQAEKQAAKDLAEQQTAALRAWAEQSGSELLKARLANGYDWRELAREEFVSAHTLPGFGGLLEADAYEKLMTPTLDQMQAYQALCAEIENNSLYSEPKLLLNTVCDEDGEESTYYSLVVRVHLPDGSTEEQEREIG